MDQNEIVQPAFLPTRRRKWSDSSPFRILKYTLAQVITIAVMMVIAVFIIIIVANLGGFMDTVIRANIDERIGFMILGGWLQDVTDEAERDAIIEQTREAMVEGAGLNKPFMLRALQWLAKGLTLDWGDTHIYVLLDGIPSRLVRDVIRDYLPRTLLVFGVSNALLFIITLFLALSLSFKYNSWQDKLVTFLAPLASAPSWVYGLVIAGFALHFINTYSVMFNEWPREFSWSLIPFYARRLGPPMLAIFLSKFFQSIYAWRTIFLLNAGEDFVEIAKAKGLPARILERRYILRPMLPNIITSFAMILFSLWQEVIVLESIFLVAGVGYLFRLAVGANDVRMIVALVTTFAYLLAMTTLILDFSYALVDPRVKVGSSSATLKPISAKRRFRLFSRRKPTLTRTRLKPAPISPGPPARTHFIVKPKSSEIIAPAPKPASTWVMVKQALQELRRYPSFFSGIALILILVGISLYAITAYPYKQTVKQWRGDEFYWSKNPSYAYPEWVNYFRKNDLPPTYRVDGTDPYAFKTVGAFENNRRQLTYTFYLDYTSTYFPQDLNFNFTSTYSNKKPLVYMTWLTPDGREFNLGNFSITSAYSYYLFLDEKLERKLQSNYVTSGMFGDPQTDRLTALPGMYKMQVKIYVFEEASDVNVEMILYGKVHGLAGTDGRRRDVLVGLAWGTPIALSFGLLASLGTTLTTTLLAAISTWFGGWIDALIQRLTEINMLLPFFPISLMIYTLYSKSFWVILGVTVLLSIFGSGIKNYRSLFMQIKELPYLEAARAYGAGDWRIILRYLIPRIAAVLIPQMVILVPTYVFLEASLSVLGLYDPLTPPTWGQLVLQGLEDAGKVGAYHLFLEPAVLLMITGYAFLLLGISMERIFEPRLRDMR